MKGKPEKIIDKIVNGRDRKIFPRVPAGTTFLIKDQDKNS